MIRTFLVGLVAVAIAGFAMALEPVSPAKPKAESAAPFRAGGNEPPWRLDIGVGKMTLLTNYGQARAEAETPRPVATPDSWKYVAHAGGRDMVVTILDRMCVDSMTGMPYPDTVTVLFEGKTLGGCGGDPAALLRGAEWLVTEINGAPVLPQSRVTMNFNADGRVSGKGTCNSYTGSYEVTGEGLRFSRPAATLMACMDAPMRQEAAFLGVLNDARTFEMPPGGALVLRTGDKRTIKAVRAS